MTETSVNIMKQSKQNIKISRKLVLVYIGCRNFSRSVKCIAFNVK
jgi:hypothetical protein